MRQPAGVRDKLGKGHAIDTLQQFDNLRDLGSATRRLSGRGCSVTRTIKECGWI
jgi:hypothetical protein